MRFEHRTLVGGPLVSGIPEELEWSRNGGSYEKSRDFFSIHWEVQTARPREVCLHVESPRADVDDVLNGIKQEVVLRMLDHDLLTAIQAAGLDYTPGKKISRSDIRCNKSTEPFRVVLPLRTPPTAIEENLEYVHEKLGSSIQAALEQFIPALQAEFGRGIYGPTL